jgi:hypothetical protein
MLWHRQSYFGLFPTIPLSSIEEKIFFNAFSRFFTEKNVSLQTPTYFIFLAAVKMHGQNSCISKVTG